MKTKNRKIDILFEDDYLIAVNKPAGVLSIPDRFRAEMPNMLALLKAQYEEIFTLHRLDKGTSGLLLFAKTAEAHRSLSIAFEKRKISKTYHAVCQGVSSETEGSILKNIAPHPSKAGKMTINKSGKVAVSHFKILQSFSNYHLVEVIIETGRTHQVRLHLQSIGLPILGDALYGKGDFFLRELKGRKYQLGKSREERPLLSRAALHAHALAFQHPVLDKKIALEAPHPKDIRATLNQLTKWKGL